MRTNQALTAENAPTPNNIAPGINIPRLTWPDAIKSGKTGYLCNGNDLSAIYENLLKILTNKKYKELGTNALEFSKDFSWEKIVKKYISLI